MIQAGGSTPAGLRNSNMADIPYFYNTRTFGRPGRIAALAALLLCILAGLGGTPLGAEAAATAWSLHISSFRGPDQAAREVSNFQSRGLDAFSRYETIPGKGRWHRVYVGRFASRADAAATARQLKRRPT